MKGPPCLQIDISLMSPSFKRGLLGKSIPSRARSRFIFEVLLRLTSSVFMATPRWHRLRRFGIFFLKISSTGESFLCDVSCCILNDELMCYGYLLDAALLTSIIIIIIIIIIMTIIIIIMIMIMTMTMTMTITTIMIMVMVMIMVMIRINRGQYFEIVLCIEHPMYRLHRVNRYLA